MRIFIPSIICLISVLLFSCNTSDKTLRVRISLTSDILPIDSITHLNSLLLTDDLGYFNGSRFSTLFKRPKVITFSKLKAIEPGVFQLDSIPKEKFYIILLTQIDSMDFALSNEPLLDLTKVKGQEAQFNLKLNKTFVRRYYDTR